MATPKKSGFLFDPKSASDEMLRLMKNSFEASFDNVTKVQHMNEKMLKEIIQQSKSVQDDALKMVNDFIANAKKGQDAYRKAMEDGFKKVEEMFKAQS